MDQAETFEWLRERSNRLDEVERQLKECLERARQTVKPIVDAEKKGEDVGDIMNLRLRAVTAAARDFIWEPENWEAYQDSKESNSAAWSPEFLLLAQAVENRYGPMPTSPECFCGVELEAGLCPNGHDPAQSAVIRSE